ncbi:MAG: NAD(P)/FAD-dependent oxidoreductase [Nitrospirota bacterium]
MRNHDVIIIGAGPVGSYTAYLLAQRGYDVGIFEKNPFVGKNINCTGIISQKCLEKVKLNETVIQRPIDSIKAFSPSGNFLKYHSSKPPAFIVDRVHFDREINQMAVKAGATIYLDAKVKEFRVSEEDFIIGVLWENKDVEFRSRIGVIATGFELNFIQRIFHNYAEFSFGIQTQASLDEINDVEVYFGREIAPGSFGWVVPTVGKLAKIGLITRSNPSGYLKKFLEHSLIKDRINGYDNNLRCSPIPNSRIPKSYFERFIIVGEAAGQVKTTTGGGIYFGMVCSEIAVKTIEKAFAYSDFSESLLREYEIKWVKKIEPELTAGRILRNLFSRLSDHQIELIIDLARKDGVLPAISKSDFDWHKDLIIYILRHLFARKIFKF